MSQPREFVETDSVGLEPVTRRSFLADGLRASAAGLLAITAGCSTNSRIEFSKEMEVRGTVTHMTFIKGMPLRFGEPGLPGQLRTPDTCIITVKFFHEKTAIEERRTIDKNLFEQLKNGSEVVVCYKMRYLIKKNENGEEEKVTNGYEVIRFEKAR